MLHRISVLGVLQKLSKLGSIGNSLGSSFQYFGPTTLKLLSAKVLFMNGTISCLNVEFECMDQSLIGLTVSRLQR